jgi:ABC-type transport system substrate-binding protein
MSIRPHRKAMSREAAFVELADTAGAGFDPRVVALRVLCTLLGVALLVAAAAACGGGAGGSSTDPAPREGGVYNYPLLEDPGLFDPAVQQMNDGTGVLHQVYEGLVRVEEQPDGSLETVPCLAESWTANADATVWTFKLRRGVAFQPPVSREVTAADVVADARYLTDRANACQLSYMFIGVKGVDGSGYAKAARLGVERLDRYTVRFTLKHPFSEFPDTLASGAFWVWPVDHLRRVGRKAYGRHPVGTGPYMFLRTRAGTSIDLVRNPEWWDTSGGPYIDTIHYQVFSSVSSMMLAFQKGEVDWTWVPRGQIGASRSLPQVQTGHWKAESSPLLALGYLLVNMADPVVGGSGGLPLRRALTYACDKQAVVDAASDGVDLPSAGLVPPGVPGAGDAPEPYPYDPATAKQLVAESGPVTLELVHPVDRFAQIVAESLRASYAEIGITLKLKPLDWNAFVARVLDGKTQMFLMGWAADYPSMDNFLYTMFHSDSSATASGTFYADREVDALLERARSTPDGDARIRLYSEAEASIMADAPAVPIVVYADYRLVDTRVADVSFNAMAWVDLWRAWVKER